MDTAGSGEKGDDGDDNEEVVLPWRLSALTSYSNVNVEGRGRGGERVRGVWVWGLGLRMAVGKPGNCFVHLPSVQ